VERTGKWNISFTASDRDSWKGATGGLHSLGRSWCRRLGVLFSLVFRVLDTTPNIVKLVDIVLANGSAEKMLFQSEVANVNAALIGDIDQDL